MSFIITFIILNWSYIFKKDKHNKHCYQSIELAQFIDPMEKRKLWLSKQNIAQENHFHQDNRKCAHVFKITLSFPDWKKEKLKFSTVHLDLLNSNKNKLILEPES